MKDARDLEVNSEQTAPIPNENQVTGLHRLHALRRFQWIIRIRGACFRSPQLALRPNLFTFFARPSPIRALA